MATYCLDHRPYKRTRHAILMLRCEVKRNRRVANCRRICYCCCWAGIEVAEGEATSVGSSARGEANLGESIAPSSPHHLLTIQSQERIMAIFNGAR